MGFDVVNRNNAFDRKMEQGRTNYLRKWVGARKNPKAKSKAVAKLVKKIRNGTANKNSRHYPAALAFARKACRTKKGYQDYLKSQWWKHRREKYIKSIECNTCESCGCRNRYMQVHHVRYGRLFNERDKDLKMLCRNCHQVEHGLAHYSLDEEYLQIVG